MQDDQGSLCLKVPAGSAACARCQWQALPMHENRNHLWRYASFGMPYPKIKKPYSHLTEKKLVHIGKPQNREIVSLEFTNGLWTLLLSYNYVLISNLFEPGSFIFSHDDDGLAAYTVPGSSEAPATCWKGLSYGCP